MASLLHPTALAGSGVLLLLLLLLQLRSPHITATTPTLTNFTFHGFTRSNLTVDGSATVTNSGLLRLTDDSGMREAAHAFFSTPLAFTRKPPNKTTSKALSFSTSFVFAIVPTYPGLGVFGMTFFISPHNHINAGPRSLRYLGLFNDTTNGNSSDHIVAVEFNLLPKPELKDLSDNHVGIDITNATSVAEQSAGYHSDEGRFTNITLLSGDPIQAWVDYDDKTEKLNVTLAPLNLTKRPTKPLCSATVDLTAVLLDQMYVGFSGTSGKASVSQYVLGWSFRINGQADPLDLSRLPKLPRRKGPGQPNIVIAAVVVVTAAVVVLGMGVAYATWRRRQMYAEELAEWEAEYGPHRISYKDLHRATKGFKEILGVGGFGKVYRGVLPRSEVEVAVKRVSHDSSQGMREFVAEVVSIGRLRHRNLVSLLGYCRRNGELLLVYDYMPNGSLDKLLFDNPPRPLDWDRRFNIIKGVASGLVYLHEEWEQVVLHRDVKASNVLLDGELNGRLGDFGLARLYDHGTAPQTTHVVGTMGYLAPELARAGRASKATDVFSYGIFLLETVCGRRPIEPRKTAAEIVLVDWVVRRWVVEGEKLAGVADGRMGGGWKAEEVEMVLKLGLLCAHVREEARPSMREVLQVLEGSVAIPELKVDFWKGCVGDGAPWEMCGGGVTGSVISGASSSAVTAADSMCLSGGR